MSQQQWLTSSSKKSNYNHKQQGTLPAYTPWHRGAKASPSMVVEAFWACDGYIQDLLKQSVFLLAQILVCLSNQVPGPSGAQFGQTRMAGPRASAD